MQAPEVMEVELWCPPNASRTTGSDSQPSAELMIICLLFLPLEREAVWNIVLQNTGALAPFGYSVRAQSAGGKELHCHRAYIEQYIWS